MAKPKTHSQSQLVLDKMIDKLDKDDSQMEKAKIMAKLVDVKFRGYSVLLKHKKMTNEPKDVAFFDA